MCPQIGKVNRCFSCRRPLALTAEPLSPGLRWLGCSSAAEWCGWGVVAVHPGGSFGGGISISLAIDRYSKVSAEWLVYAGRQPGGR